MRISSTLLCLLLVATAVGQQQNSVFSALNIDAPANHTVPAPVSVTTFTDTVLSLNMRGWSQTPVIVLFATSFANGGSLSIGAIQDFGFQIDLADIGVPGYADQEFVNGYLAPGSLSFTDGSGDLSLQVMVPSCTNFGGVPICIQQSNFEVSSQAIVQNPIAPFGISSTGAGIAQFTNGYDEYSPTNGNPVQHAFKNGFTFTFYGQTHTGCFISEDGHISFGSGTGSGFFNPTISSVVNGPPRIMCWNSDLSLTFQTFSPRIFVKQYFDTNGVEKVEIVHERISEFGDTTGPHGGTITLTDTGDLAVLVAPYNAQPSINTLIGISPGIASPGAGNPSGLDLSVAATTGPTALGAGAHGFEFFPSVNPMVDLIGFGWANNSPVGQGLVFTVDGSLPNTTPSNSGYFVQ